MNEQGSAAVSQREIQQSKRQRMQNNC